MIILDNSFLQCGGGDSYTAMYQYETTSPLLLESGQFETQLPALVLPQVLGACKTTMRTYVQHPHPTIALLVAITLQAGLEMEAAANWDGQRWGKL